MSLLEPRHKNPESIVTNAPGLLLLDRKHRAIFYNAEAAQILNSSITQGKFLKNRNENFRPRELAIMEDFVTGSEQRSNSSTSSEYPGRHALNSIPPHPFVR
jgi:hypothetical protein